MCIAIHSVSHVIVCVCVCVCVFVCIVCVHCLWVNSEFVVKQLYMYVVSLLPLLQFSLQTRV